MHYDISEQAITFLNSLFKEYQDQFSVILKLTAPSTPSAQVALELEHTESLENNPALQFISVGHGKIFFMKEQESVVQNLKIGYRATLTGGELEIDLPLLYGDQKSFPLIERIKLYFQKEIQPALDAHRGHAVIKEITADNDLVIAFAGGCQGCSLASVTLKNLIDQKIRENFPQIRSIIDSTNHAAGDRPYA